MEHDATQNTDTKITEETSSSTAPRPVITERTKPAPYRKPSFINRLFLLATCMGVGFFGGWLGSARQNEAAGLVGDAQTNTRIVSSEGEVISTLAKEAGESVVSINSVTEVQRNSFFFGPTTQQAAGAGTGIIINSDGLILTNKHVVPEGTTEVTITLSDGTELEDVEVIGRGRQSEDIAFLKVGDKKDKTLKAAKIGDSSAMQVGEKVIAIGNAKGRFQNTVTEGIVSGLGRNIEAGDQDSSEELYNLIQTDAAINSGNSGGPLVNINGEVIGINVAIDGDAQNIGFAIPINDVKGLITSVTERGELIRPYLGVRYVMITDDFAYEYNLPLKRGAYLAPTGAAGQSPIIKDSPAAKAGLKEKDIITKVNGTEINEQNVLSSVLGTFSAGDEITLTILRDSNEQEIKVTLAEAPRDN